MALLLGVGFGGLEGGGNVVSTGTLIVEDNELLMDSCGEHGVS